MRSNAAGLRPNRHPVRRLVRVALLGAVLSCALTPQSWAWGKEGHRLTALVAEHYLTPETRAAIAQLLGKQTLADVAPWADEYRQEHPETAPWHYVDIPAQQQAYDRQRDCPLPAKDPASPWRDCVTDRILYFEGRLGDATLSPQERAIALKFLVHLIGDIHQPFHALGDFRGGNDIHLSFLGTSQCESGHCNLHGIWDDSLISERNLSEKKYTDLLLQAIQENHWENLSGGAPSAWANISHHYAVDALMPTDSTIGRAYVTEESKIVDAQLALGGLRLARVLNRILAPDVPPAPATPKP
jgi:hypothetical protein